MDLKAAEAAVKAKVQAAEAELKRLRQLAQLRGELDEVEARLQERRQTAGAYHAVLKAVEAATRSLEALKSVSPKTWISVVEQTAGSLSKAYSTLHGAAIGFTVSPDDEQRAAELAHALS